MAKVNDKMIKALESLDDLVPDDYNYLKVDLETVKAIMHTAGDLLEGCHEYFSEHFKELQEKVKKTGGSNGQDV